MTKRFPLYLILGLIVMGVTAACNDDDSTSYYYDSTEYDNCAISSFSLAEDDSVLRDLDSVFFSIDLVKALVYNADSLPKGTDVSRLIVNVTASAASKVEFTFKSLYSGSDTIVNITDNPNDSINFSAGPVTMTVTSYNGQATRNYQVSVLVHTVEADTLYWDTLQQVSLPKEASAQKTVMLGGKTYTLLSGVDGLWYLAVNADPESDGWQTSTPSLPSSPDINSFSATDDALYITDTTGNLYTSTDGQSWTATGVKMNCVYGGYGTRLLGARQDSDGWKHVTWPATTETAVKDCPVSGTSQLVIYQTKWSESDMAIMIGGRDSAGQYTGDTWAYDGSAWNRISTTGIDEREGVTLFPYSTPKVSSTSWTVTEESALIAMGGRYETESGVVADKTVYISYDFGITWKEADSYLQFPESYPDFSDAQAFVIDYTLHARSTADNAWHPLATRGLPCWGTPIRGSRVEKPITSWECPYIFLFGGVKTDGELVPYVTRGVINRFTFKPLY